MSQPLTPDEEAQLRRSEYLPNAVPRLLATLDAARAVHAECEANMDAEIDRLRNPEPIPDTPSLREAALEVVTQLAVRYDDQWATGPVLLTDLDRLRIALDPEAEAER